MIIIHGDNIVSSRLCLTDTEKQFLGEIVRLNGKTCTLTDLLQAVESSSLFGVDRLVVLENALTNKKSQKEILEYLKKNQPDNLIIWENKELSKTDLLSFPKAKIQIFKIDKTLFKLMEALRPNNKQNIIKLYNQTIKTEDPDMVFAMFIRQFRFLILSKLEQQHELVVENFPEDYARMQPWQKSRLTEQAKFFTIDVLKNLYADLLQIDVNNKTSSSAMDLSSQLELFLIKL